MADLSKAGAPIWAAGGVLRRGSADNTEVCLVHRPRYDDWSLPKGKLRAGERTLSAAVREVYEETGVRGAPLMPLPAARYLVRGRPKLVRYWAMRVLAVDEFRPNAEVDERRWLPLPVALSTVSYSHDVTVLRVFAGLTAVDSVVLLVGPGSARHRGWPGTDAALPLDTQGAAQAAQLADELALFAPQRLICASPRRCVATLAPLAAAVDVPIEVDSTFDAQADVGAATRRLDELAGAAVATVVCAQHEIVAAVVAALAGSVAPYPVAKKACWVLPFAGRTLVGAYPLPS